MELSYRLNNDYLLLILNFSHYCKKKQEEELYLNKELKNECEYITTFKAINQTDIFLSLLSLPPIV